MQNVYVFAAVIVSLCGGCATGSIGDDFRSQNETIAIYHQDGRIIASVGDINLEARDCSDANLRCIRINNQLAFIYPRKCPYGQGYHALRWKRDGVETFLSAPYPDLGLPAGVYMSTSSENVSYDYDPEEGLTGIVVAKAPVSSNEYNRGDYDRKYRVEFPMSDFNSFKCE